MILATLRDGTADGRLVLVSPDYARYARAPVGTLQAALEQWDALAPGLGAITDFTEALDTADLAAPLPRAWQWLDGSVYASHGDLMDQVISIGDVRMKVVKRIKRCAATNVDPDTAARDMTIPKTLMDTYGHPDLGVYAEVIEGGTIAEGDALVV